MTGNAANARRNAPAWLRFGVALALLCACVLALRMTASASAHAPAAHGTSSSQSGGYGSGAYGAGSSLGQYRYDDASLPAPLSELRAAARPNPPASAEAETRAIETALLGPEHAAEHAAVRAAERKWARLGHQPHLKNPKDALSSRGAPMLQNAGNDDPPDEVGEWTQAPFQLPTYAIQTTVLPTGKVLFWGRPPDPLGPTPRANVGQAALWDPSKGTGADAFTDVAPPTIDVDGPGGQPPAPAPIFCSGMTQEANGDVLVAGGTLIYGATFGDDAYNTFAGLNTVFTFNPFNQTWTQQPNMQHGRWYPTEITLPDGRSLIAGGLGEQAPGGVINNTIDLFTPSSDPDGQGTVEPLPSASKGGLGLYPRLFSLDSTGNVLQLGPERQQVKLLNTSSFTWTKTYPPMSTDRFYGSAVRDPGGPGGSDAFTTIGGYAKTNGDDFNPATATDETFDADAKTPSWMPNAPLNVPRANANTVLLPDGSMVEVGGGSGYDAGDGGGYVTYADGRARQVELWDPQTKTWRLGPEQQEDRAYHSTAVLLPDGRVFSAGDDVHPLEPNGGPSQTDDAEIYSPPYLFKGPRPQIDSAPQAVRWSDAFGIHSSSPDIQQAVLMAPGATTHAFDSHQRYVKLQVLDKVDGQGVDVAAPPNSKVAPPGYYMLFLINGDGVPSVASWIKLDGSAPDQSTIGPPPEGDFNGDGFPDLVVGAPGATVGSTNNAGVVHILYGGASGLTDAGNQVFSQDDLATGTAATGNRFGAAVATGDFNGDGYADLAVGAPGEDVSSARNAGAVDILYGSPSGLTTSGAQVWTQDNGGITDVAESGDHFGAALAADDLDGDGRADLAIGVPNEGINAATDAGAVNVLYGSNAGIRAVGDQLWTQNSTGILDAAESGDEFGSSLSIGDLNGDGDGDLAIGVPGESVGTNAGAGAVNVIYGSGAGLAATGNQLWTQNSGGILDGSEAGDRFGAAVAIGDLNGDADADLAVGAPGENIGTTRPGAGAVNVIYGASGGLSSAGNQLWTQNTTDILDAAEPGDSFGAALRIGDMNGDGSDDLAIGVPGESVGTNAGAGAVNVIYGSGSGLTAAGNQVWDQNSVGIVDTSEAGDAFGSALASTDLNRDGNGDLAIGVPSESVGSVAGAGALNVIYGSAGGLTNAGNQLFTEDSPGFLDNAAPGDEFGAALGAG